MDQKAIDELLGRRREANAKILLILGNILGEHPEWRFCQALFAARVEVTSQTFYEEPWETLEKMQREVNSWKQSELTQKK